MTSLVDIFDILDLQGVLYFRTNFTQPWSVEVPPLGQAARFHLITHGQCFFKFPSGNMIRANAGDLIIIPGGSSHMMSCEPIERATDLNTVMELAGYTGDGLLVYGGGQNPDSATQIICGHFDFRGDAEHPILSALPEYITIREEKRAQNPFLDNTMKMIVESVMTGKLGSEATFKRLSEIVFIEVLSDAAMSDQALGTVLEAFADVHIGQSLDIIHKNIQTQWTVSSLAAQVGLSRSRFAERFKALMSVGPMTYLSDWRIQKSMTMLQKTPMSVKSIATQIGYQSPAAFTRAFTQKTGQSPTDYRKSSLPDHISS